MTLRGVRDYLQLGAVPHPRTIYQGVHMLAPGSTLTIQAWCGAETSDAYWTVPGCGGFHRPRGRSPAQNRSRASGSGATSYLRSDVPVGLFLSGGIDSGLVASLAAEAGARNLLAFVVEVEDPALNEAPAALWTSLRTTRACRWKWCRCA